MKRFKAYEWHRHLLDGQESTGDNECFRWTSTSRNAENVALGPYCVRKDSRQTHEEIPAKGLRCGRVVTHRSQLVKQFFAKLVLMYLLTHPLYSPDLDSHDFYLFPLMKKNYRDVICIIRRCENCIVGCVAGSC